MKLSLSLCKSIRRVVGYFNFPEWFVNAVENALIMTFPICFAKPLDNIPSRAKATSLLAFQPMSAIFKLLDETQQNIRLWSCFKRSSSHSVKTSGKFLRPTAELNRRRCDAPTAHLPGIEPQGNLVRRLPASAGAVRLRS